MTDRATVRLVACAELAHHEHWYRTQAHALEKTVDADAMTLLTRGVDVDPDASQKEREDGARMAWQRVDAGRTRAKALRLVSRVLRRILGVLGGEPIHERDAVPETVRQARVGMFVQQQEERAETMSVRTPAHPAGDLTKNWLVQHADELDATEAPNAS